MPHLPADVDTPRFRPLNVCAPPILVRYCALHVYAPPILGRNDLGLRIRPILQRVLRKLEDQEAKDKAEAETPEATEAEAGEATASEDTAA